MKTFSPKHSKKADPRQAMREAHKAANGTIAPERIAKVHVLSDGQELIELNPVTIPGYTYSF